MPSPKRNGRYANGHRRRQLRALVLARDTHCHLCGGEVDTSLPAGLPASPEVHETIPFSKGGNPYDPEICVLTHRLCNQKFGNGDRRMGRRRIADFTTTARRDQ